MAPRSLLGSAVAVPLAIAFLLAVAPPVAAVDIFVTPGATADLADVDLGNGVCNAGGGVCTLRAAVQEANFTAAHDRIVVPAGTYVLTRLGADEDSASLGDLDLLHDVDIEGAGAGVTVVDGNDSDRIFDVAYGVAVGLSGMTIRNGRVQSPLHSLGGGIYLHGAVSLDLVGCAIEGNRANRGGGLDAHSDGNIVSIVGSVFKGNRALDYGFTLAFGGAIENRGDLDIEDTTLTGNSADQGGGAISSGNGTLSLRNSTVSGNLAGLLAGGIEATSTDVDLVNVTILGNKNYGLSGSAAPASGHTLSMKNSIVAASTGSGFDCYFNNVILDVAGKHNLDSDGSCGLDGSAGDVPNTDPMLDALLWNGGATPTHVPLRGSPVIDAGDNATCEAADQRGAPRPLDGDGMGAIDVCDMGAVEVLPCVPPFVQDEELTGLTISGANLFVACFTITAGPAFVVEPGGLAEFRARDSIILRDGFAVEGGGTFQAIRDPAAGSFITLP